MDESNCGWTAATNMSVYAPACACVCVCMSVWPFFSAVCVCSACVCALHLHLAACVQLFCCMCYINPLHTHPLSLSFSLAILTSLSHWPPFGKIFILFCRSFELCAPYYKSGSHPCVCETDLLHLLPPPGREIYARFIPVLLSRVVVIMITVAIVTSKLQTFASVNQFKVFFMHLKYIFKKQPFADQQDTICETVWGELFSHSFSGC